MSYQSTPQFAAKGEFSKDTEKVVLGEQDDSMHSPSIVEGVDILGLQALDRALNAKMHIVNNVRNSQSAPLPLQLEFQKRQVHS